MISATSSSGIGNTLAIASLMASEVRSPSRSEYSFFTCWMMASSSSSPPMRMRGAGDDAPQRDDGHLRRAAADVDHHVAGGLVDGEPGADRRRHRLFDDVGAARPRRDRRFLDRALLHPGDPGGHADDHARLGEEAALVHLLDEVPEHLLGDVEVGDHAVLQRTHRLDVGGCAADHALGLGAHGKDGSGKGVDRDDARLVQHDTATTHVHQRVRGPEVDGHVATKEPQYPFRPLGAGRRGRRTLNPLGHDGFGVHSTGAPGGWQPGRADTTGASQPRCPPVPLCGSKEGVVR